ncbi:MAG TPA: M20/M25/M40 family metallo-hydrolase, partial [Phnomibacter sp.]|nr:M20/M25/M40 family metallo-hydrolase [Phnomibacter sp.]
MMRRSILLLLVSLFFSATSFSNDTLILQRMGEHMLKNGKAYENLRVLCKDIGQRLSGSEGAAKAVQATAQMLRDAGADTVYLQPVMVPHWERGPKEQAIIHYSGKQQRLRTCLLGMSIGTGERGIKAPVVMVRDFDELKALGAEKVKGKIVFINYPMRPELITNGYGDAVRFRSGGPAEAGRLGAVAVMIRSVTHALDTFPHTGGTRYDKDVDPIPAFACSTVDAEWLADLLKKQPQGVELFLKATPRSLPDALSYNVIGEIRGSRFPDEIVTVGGHLDSWDLGEGAHDDGAGCVQSIEVIAAIKALGLKPQRTIRAVMFMNEENGLKGALAYADSAERKKEKHVYAIESDLGAFSPVYITLGGTPSQNERVRQWLPLLRQFWVLHMPEGGPGADIGPLRRLGPMVGNMIPYSQRYFDYHHTAADRFEAVHKRELEMGAAALASMCW